jgi:hypothetical protein
LISYCLHWVVIANYEAFQEQNAMNFGTGSVTVLPKKPQVLSFRSQVYRRRNLLFLNSGTVDS